MKRLHVSVNVEAIDPAIVYYSALFGSGPDVKKSDYARWRLDEPAVNFSIAARGRPNGVDHLGLDVDSEAELHEVTDRLTAAGEATSQPTPGTCCYHQSTKSWSLDPAGMAWETFHTVGDAAVYGTDKLDERAIASVASNLACVPSSAQPADTDDKSCC